MIKKLTDRFYRLDNEIRTIEATKKNEHGDLGPYLRVDKKLLLAWVVKTKNLFVSACGEKSQHYKEFVKAEEIRPYESNYDSFERMKAVFSAAMDDYKGGFLTTIN